jgi:undecaprenol kinase/diacylglycerol kinase (ATP)
MCRSDLLRSFRVAFTGLWYALRTQRNLRIQLVVTGVVIVLGLWLGLSADQWAVLALTSGLVLLGELVNTVVERLVDLVCPDYDPLAKVVKDVMAGAVVLACIVAIIVGLLVLGPPLWSRLVS